MPTLPEFKNKALFDKAFTHRSYLNEAKQKIESNERLEFLGDSIVSFVISSYLYERYPDFNEGILTNIRSLLVNTKSLANIAASLDFGKYLKLSKGEEDSQGRKNISLLADCFEAYIGALYLDQGVDVVRTFLMACFLPLLEPLVENRVFKDPKSLLQEYVQAQKQNSPIYSVIHEEGPAHAKIFTVGVYVDDQELGQGTGKSKQEAEENAASQALTQLKAPLRSS